MTRSTTVSTSLSRAPLGLAAPLVRVEVHLGAGLPSFTIVGLPEAVVRESKERVRAALLTAGLEFPSARITVNLSPADLPKEGGRFDLPIAVAILTATAQLPRDCLQEREFYGELSLGGELRETAKLLPALIAGSAAGRELIVPEANALEASIVRGARIRTARDLAQLCAGLSAGAALPRVSPPVQATVNPPPADLSEVRGQHQAKRALEVAAAGEHAAILIGPPGAGKTLIAQRLSGLLPPLDLGEALEVASIASAAGNRPCATPARPFRAPHHTASVAALIGGYRPGEISLAHRGVLFLDELPEFPRNALEALREPLESGAVMLARAKRCYEWPARFQLIAAMNPCACGYHGDPRGRCRCTADQVQRYRSRISGPLLDRIDIHVPMRAVRADELLAPAQGDAERSSQAAARVAAARSLQIDRQGKLNAHLTAAEVGEHCRLDAAPAALLLRSIERLGLSARAYHRVLKLARTCADLAGSPRVELTHVAEAIGLRTLDRPVA